jgi:uncharacterized protein
LSAFEKAIYSRFREKGRMMPDGLSVVRSWVTADLGHCFQLLECDDVPLLQRWAAGWSDLIEFEIVPVVQGKDTPVALSSWRGRQMLYAVLFEDNQGLGLDVRREHMAAHLAFLEKNATEIKAAGPFAHAPGGLWLVEANNAERVDALVKEDPFWPTGLRRSVRILRWSQIFSEGKRL